MEGLLRNSWIDHGRYAVRAAPRESGFPVVLGLPPFALTPEMIAECFKPELAVDKFFKNSHFVNQARDRLATAAREGIRNLNSSRIKLDGKKVQKGFADRFKEALIPPSLEELLASRFNKHFMPLCTPRWIRFPVSKVRSLTFQ